MQTIALRARVGGDGILHLEVPVALTDTELDVKLTVQPVKEETDSPEGRGWPPGFFEETFGCCQDDPLIIDIFTDAIAESPQVCRWFAGGSQVVRSFYPAATRTKPACAG